MKKTLTIVLLLTLISTVSFADAYNACIGCHGVNGERKALNKSKIIKDMTKEEIKISLIGYQDGTYGGALRALMSAKVKNISSADIEFIAKKIGK